MRCCSCDKSFNAKWHPKTKEYDKYCKDCQWKEAPALDPEQMKKDVEEFLRKRDGVRRIDEETKS